jgi:hypothetical protein
MNQNDLNERGQQLSIMGSLYAKATRVVIWLGHDKGHVGPGILRMVTRHDTLDSLSQSQTDAVNGLLKCAWFSKLYAARGHSATDPRDHVYAFLGHPANLSDGRALLRVEYTRTIPEVFRDTTIKFLRSMGNLDVLSYVTHEESLHLRDGLPSWVPVWDCLPLTSTGLDIRVFPFPESGLFQEEIRDVSKKILIDVSNEDKVLSLRGLEVNVVEWHSESIVYKMIPPGLWDCGKEEHPLETLWTDLKSHYLSKPSNGNLLKLFSLLLTSRLIKMGKAEDRIDNHNANFQAWRLKHSEKLQPEAGELFPGRDQQRFSMLRKAAEGGIGHSSCLTPFELVTAAKCSTRKMGFWVWGQWP